jgi:hypothetical protein
MQKLKQVCYNCGVELNDDEVTREHIPAKNLFDGYEDTYKDNRITVSACLNCNNKYSQSDEEFRNMLGIIAKKNKNTIITEKSVRSLLRKDSRLQRLRFNNFMKLSGVAFNEAPIANYHKKNFRGLYYYHYKLVLTDDYDLFVNIDENDFTDLTLGMLGYLTEHFNWRYSGNLEIMKYIIQPFRPNISNESKKDLTPEVNENIFLCYMDFHNEHSALVIAVRKRWLNDYKTKLSL